MRITIDGGEHEVEPGTMLLAAIRAAGIELPALCHDDRIAPAAVCRLCLVEVGGILRPQPACATPARDGMAVSVLTPRLEAQRRTILEMLAWSHPPDAMRRDAHEPFVRIVEGAGLAGELHGQAARQDSSHPYIRVDMSRCIECLRCVRICNEVQGQFTWRIDGRGASMRIVPDSWGSLRDSSCVACGACVDTCPTGALADETRLQRGDPDTWTRTTCPYCGVGCELSVGTKDGTIVQSLPVLDAPVNRGHLCSKGRYAFDFGSARDRITEPLLRTSTGWRAVSWDEAVAHVAGRLDDIRDRRGPDAIGLLGSSRATNEENYVAQKFARLVIGTNNVDCCARVCHAPSAAALSAMLGAGAATNSFADVELARAILVFGSDTTECHPVVGARIKQAALRGTPLILVDPRRTELARYSAVHLRPRPGTNVHLLHAMAHVILEEGLADSAFLRDRVDGLDDFRTFVKPYTPEAAAKLTGVEPGLVREAARIYAGNRPAISFHGLGLTEQLQGTEGVECLVNLALLTGNLGRPGAGVNPLRGQNNVQGAAHMGCEPAHLTGYAPLDQRDRFAKAWGEPLPVAKGLDLLEMVQAAEEGRLAAIWTIGYDFLLTDPELERTRAALAKLELLVVQDLFLTRTAEDVGTVFLPAATAFEKEGTFMNGERRVQRVRKVKSPPPGPRTDWEILAAVARAMGHPRGFEHASAREIWEEIRSVWPAGAGLGWDRLEERGLQWPCPDEAHPGSAMLHVDRFVSGPRATLRPIVPLPPAEQTDAEHPFVLITGRSLYAFNAGTMTGRTPHATLRPRDLLDVSPEDASRLGLGDGDRAVIESRHGACTLPVRITGELRPGEVFATFHEPRALVNRLIGPAKDGVTHTPAYKVTAVRIRKESPPGSPGSSPR